MDRFLLGATPASSFVQRNLWAVAPRTAESVLSEEEKGKKKQEEIRRKKEELEQR